MGYDELLPLNQKGVDGLGGLGAIVVDALDTAMVMRLDEVVSEAGSWIERHLLERINQKGHSNAIPFSDVVLSDRSTLSTGGLSSTSEVSTLQLEFNYLSFLTGDPKCSLESMKVLEHIKNLPKAEGLVPIYISLRREPVNTVSQKQRTEGPESQDNKENETGYLIVRTIYLINRTVNGHGGQQSANVALNGEHLGGETVCFLPGTLALDATKGITKAKAVKDSLLTVEDLENLKLAEDLVRTCFERYSVTSTGLAPEIAYFNGNEGGLDGGNKHSKYVNDIIIKVADRQNLLRPETVESLFVLYRITGDPKYRKWGWEIFMAFEKYAKVDSGGYCSLDDVTMLPPQKRDKMEAFFLGETLKYLYLLFGDRNPIPLDKFVFNTESSSFSYNKHYKKMIQRFHCTGSIFAI
ncbi:hypothetical protein LguiA_025090 [Lonicera macranthoides]